MSLTTVPPRASTRSQSLPWGRRYAMVAPHRFRVDYSINPYMDVAVQPDVTRAAKQWMGLASRLRRLGARVEVIEPLEDAPDMVYAMNLGLALTDSTSGRVALSRMRYPQRRVEAAVARAWFESAGFAPLEASASTGAADPDPCFEAGDAFPWAGELIVGHGPRTDEAALAELAAGFDISVRGLRITSPRMYHLDLAFCPLDDEAALVCPSALDPASAVALLALVPDPVLLSESEALTFCANSVVVGRTLVMPACPPRVHAELVRRGFTMDVVDVSEFHKGGGSVRCLTNPLDIVVGRDLERVPGGRVR